MKPFKTLDEQIQHLQQNKQVLIPRTTKAKQNLYDGNYYNVISCSKIKFAKNIAGKTHIYSETQFKDWLAYFQLDCQISKHLMQNMIDFERKLNSRIAYCVSELLENKDLTDYERNEIHQLIGSSNCWKGNLDYHGKEAWVFITKMTFGEMKQLIFWLLKNRPDIYDEVVLGLPYLGKVENTNKKIRDKINELNNLRNCLFHFTPLTIYVTYGKTRTGKLKNKARKQAIKWLFDINRKADYVRYITEIFECSDKFCTIKNSQHKVD